MKLLRYGLTLLLSIYKSTAQTIYYVWKTKGDFTPEIMPCTLQTASQRGQTLVCMGITLTPGTLVCQKEDSRIFVLQLPTGERAPHAAFDKALGGKRC